MMRTWKGSFQCCGIDGCIFVVVVIPKVMAADDAVVMASLDAWIRDSRSARRWMVFVPCVKGFDLSLARFARTLSPEVVNGIAEDVKE